MNKVSSPKYIKLIEEQVKEKMKSVKKPNSELLEAHQSYLDEVLEIYQTALESLISSSMTYTCILNKIKQAYENALNIRNERITQFIIQDKVFGISVRKKERDMKVETLLRENDDLKQENLKLGLELTKLKKDMGKV